MLLIGSRAARFHYPEFRKPKDYDFIATRAGVDAFLKNRKHIINSSHQKKIRAKVLVNSKLVQFEFDLVSSYRSNHLIFNSEIEFGTYDKKLKTSYSIAKPETLFLLKKSHIVFPIHWHKNIVDYLFLKNKLFSNEKSTDLAMDIFSYNLFLLRRNETIEKKKYKERNFDLNNSDFFQKSEKFVKRKVEHDSIHYATCFYDRPLFLDVKQDLSKAALSKHLVDNLSFDDKIKLIQEEAMALSLERYIIPALISKKEYDANNAFVITAGKMVYNYLPDFLKDFAADNFDKIITLPVDYVSEFLTRHKTFSLDFINENKL